MPLFEEFRESSQETFESEHQSHFPWDVSQNSSKSGMLRFLILRRRRRKMNKNGKCHFSKNSEKRPRGNEIGNTNRIFPGTFLWILQKVAFCVFSFCDGDDERWKNAKCHFSKNSEKRPRENAIGITNLVSPGTFLRILRKVAFSVFVHLSSSPSQNQKTQHATFRRILRNVPGKMRLVIPIAYPLGRFSEFFKKWHFAFLFILWPYHYQWGGGAN